MAANQSGIYKVYSFADVTFSLSHPLLGMAQVDGSGIGTITLTNDGERSTKQLAADGSVLISKIRDRTGTMTLDFLQTSPLHNQLIDWFISLENNPAADWGRMTGVIKSIATNEETKLTGVCFVRIANKAYAAQGQNVQWSFLVADVDHRNLASTWYRNGTFASGWNTQGQTNTPIGGGL
jgi:hypothetical protein